MQIQVFIQNQRGSNKRNLYNEKTLEHIKTLTISRKYPYHYGFILNTTTDDGDNLDCYVLTNELLKTGQIVECEPIGVMEQFEDDEEDHNILAVLKGETRDVTENEKQKLTEFVSHHFEVGRFLERDNAIALIQKCQD